MTENEIEPVRRNHRGRRITVATVAAIGLTAGGITLAQTSFASGGGRQPSGAPSAAPSGAPSNAPRPPAGDQYGLDGTITSVSSGSITVKDRFGTTRTYAITDDTTISRGGSKVTASTLAGGDRVGVRGTKSGSSYKATDIDVHLAHIDGTVASESDGALTVTDDDGFTRTVAVSTGTTYTKDGAKADRSAVTTGSVVHAEGTVDSDGTTLDATAVDVLTKAPIPPAGGPGAGAPRGGHGPADLPGAGKGKRGSMPKPPSGAPSGKPSAPSGAPSAPSGAPSAPSGAPSAPSTAPSGGASSGS